MVFREWHAGTLLVVAGALILSTQVGSTTENRTPVDPAPENFVYERNYYYILLDNFGIVVAGIALMSSGATVLIRGLLARRRSTLVL